MKKRTDRQGSRLRLPLPQCLAMHHTSLTDYLYDYEQVSKAAWRGFIGIFEHAPSRAGVAGY